MQEDNDLEWLVLAFIYISFAFAVLYFTMW